MLKFYPFKFINANNKFYCFKIDIISAGEDMIGAIAGDIIGSAYEIFRTKRKDFKLFTFRFSFTDDTVLTFAVAGRMRNIRS